MGVVSGSEHEDGKSSWKPTYDGSSSGLFCEDSVFREDTSNFESDNQLEEEHPDDIELHLGIAERTIQDLRQFNSVIKQQLTAKKEELESCQREAEDEIKQLQENLSKMEKRSRFQQERSKERSLALEQLTNQNERLTQDLQKKLNDNEKLKSDMREMRSNLKQFENQQYVTSKELESLKMERDKLKTQNSSLVHRLAVAAHEKEFLEKDKEAASQRVEMLEKFNITTNEKLKTKEKELLDLTEQFSEVQYKAQDLCEKYDVSSDNMEISLRSLTSGASSNMSLLEELAGDDEGPIPVDAFSQLRVETAEVYHQLQLILEDLESNSGDQSSYGGRQRTSSSVSSVQELNDGNLLAAAKQIRKLLKKLKCDSGAMENQINTGDKEVAILKTQISELQHQNSSLSNNNEIHCTECSQSLQLENMEGELAKRCEELEAELTLAHHAIVKLERELFGTIQKKVEVSQQLELWQIDMEEYIDSNVQKRLLAEANQRKQFLREKEAKSKRKKSRPFSVSGLFNSRKSLP